MTIRIGVIGGSGIFGETHLQAFTQLQKEGRCELTAISGRNKERLAQRSEQYHVTAYTDHRTLLEKERLDGVSIVTPDTLHGPMVLDALQAGCHVLVEKPMDVTVEGCERMMQAAQKAGKLLMVDFHKRFDPYHIALKEAIEAGKIGIPLYGYAWMEDRIEVPRDWFPEWAPLSSPAWFLGTHMIDLFRWAIGRRNAKRVQATGIKKKMISLGIDTYDAIQAKIEFEDDINLNLDCCWILPPGFEAIVNQGIRIVGTEGLLEVDSQNRGAEACFAGKTQETLNLGFKLISKDKWGHTRYEGYGYKSIMELVENIEYLESGGSLEMLKGTYADGLDGLEVTRIASAIHESILSRECINLDRSKG